MNVLKEAIEVVKHREAQYGPPIEHWSKTIGAINAMYGTNFKPRDWAVFMALDKLAREQNSPLRDNIVDVCGYMSGIERCDNAEPTADIPACPRPKMDFLKHIGATNELP